MSSKLTYTELLQRNEELQTRLIEAEEILSAIRGGEVDAFFVSTPQGGQVLFLEGTDHPYRLLVEEMQQGAATISADGTILYCNQYFAETVDFPRESLKAQQFDRFVISDERARFAAFRQDLTAVGSSEQEFNLQGGSNQVIPVNIAANLLPLNSTKVICIIVADLRQRKVAEQQAIELEVERQRIKVLADFVENTSHDLRTPITVILTGLAYLAHIKDAGRRQNKIHQIETYVLYLNRVLEQLQQMAVLDSITELVVHTGVINCVIEDAIVNVQKTALEKSVTVVANLSSDTLEVRFEKDMLSQALTELLENAIRYSPTGGQVLVRSSGFAGQQLMIEVINEGPGIDAKSLLRIFERFFKADKARGMTGGAGLGLPMVKRIVELHHGSIEADSMPHKETVFRIRLPLTQIRRNDFDRTP